MPAALRADLENHLADMLVCDLRTQNESKSMVRSPGGLNREARKSARSQGCALPRGSAL